jgi:hypothetical protein
MDRNPRNTAVFILAVYPLVGQPEYQDNLAKTIKVVQKLGFEPYVVSQHDELLIEANLFIKLVAPCSPLEAIKSYWKQYNFVLMDDVVFDSGNLVDMFEELHLPRVYVSLNLRTLAVGFENDGTDWLRWMGELKDHKLVSVPLSILNNSTKLELPCATTIS